jgi:AcrR family transcriptional regulator
MARKASPSKTRKKASRPRPAPKTGGSDRERVIRAFMDLLAEKPFERIGRAEIAARAGVSLAQLRGAFVSPLAILAAHAKEIDREVLAGGDADMAEEPPRQRLFDVLMRRLEALEPDKAALRSLMHSAACSPGLALALNGIALRSQQWMLTAADINASGAKGVLRAQGLALLFAQVVRTWLDDEDPGLARTMAELDRGLASGERWVQLLDDLCCLVPSPRGPRRRSRKQADGEAAAA